MARERASSRERNSSRVEREASAQLRVGDRTSASSKVDTRSREGQARASGTCPKMPLACTGTMQKALRISVQKQK